MPGIITKYTQNIRGVYIYSGLKKLFENLEKDGIEVKICIDPTLCAGLAYVYKTFGRRINAPKNEKDDRSRGTVSANAGEDASRDGH